jgi:hypothetical protein
LRIAAMYTLKMNRKKKSFINATFLLIKKLNICILDLIYIQITEYLNNRIKFCNFQYFYWKDKRPR